MPDAAGPLRRRTEAIRAMALGAVFLAVAACGPEVESAVQRGDRLLAAGEVDAAIAEYKLALRQEGPEPAILLRLGRAHARSGDVDEVLRHLSPLLAEDSAWAVPVAAELSEAARVAREEGSPENMARALGPVLDLGPGFVPRDLRLPLARQYASVNDWGRAVPLYLAAEEAGDLEGEAVLELARAFQELGGCRAALPYFERYLAQAGRRERTGAMWQYGACLYEVAMADRVQGRRAESIERLDVLIEQGIPRTLLDRAHYARGEMHLETGDTEAAERDFLAVLELNPVRSGPLVRLAEERIREIRFGVR
ncbi:MAG: tetratricopeptide repeat protein [Gemmatimonadota bacterium]|nr:tetratricopeptide repeat protein [Gemmatimonadota bacterium]